MTTSRSRTAALTRSEAEDLLVEEATLLDDFALDRWLGMYTDDAVYWVPARHDGTDPDRHVSLIHDDRGRMEERVWRLSVGPAHAQIPSSTTTRLVTNVRVAPGAEAPVVHSTFALFEVRKGVQRTFAGRYEHHLRPGDDGWRIQQKIIRLVNCDAPIFNLTFLL
jgi:3-phenylpropionate/cinnamic acid dioxygenase small subunit